MWKKWRQGNVRTNSLLLKKSRHTQHLFRMLLSTKSEILLLIFWYLRVGSSFIDALCGSTTPIGSSSSVNKDTLSISYASVSLKLCGLLGLPAVDELFEKMPELIDEPSLISSFSSSESLAPLVVRIVCWDKLKGSNMSDITLWLARILSWKNRGFSRTSPKLSMKVSGCLVWWNSSLTIYEFECTLRALSEHAIRNSQPLEILPFTCVFLGLLLIKNGGLLFSHELAELLYNSSNEESVDYPFLSS